MRTATLVLIALMLVMPTPILPQAPQRDKPFDVTEARVDLGHARAFLDRAGGEWGGHRVAAIKHIDAALEEINEAEKWAREHGAIH